MAASRPVTVSLYQEHWKNDFTFLSDWYKKELIGDFIEIYHVGSTSVEGLAAKPIIDIDIEVEEKKFDIVKNKLKNLGYRFKGDLGIKDRYAFKYEGLKDLAGHNLYVCPTTSIELKRHIAYRDYLRSHPQAREKYSKIKLDAIRNGKTNIDDYMDYKGEVVVEILEKAMIWAGIQPHSDKLPLCQKCKNSVSEQFKIRYTGLGSKSEYFKYTCNNCGFNWEQVIS